MTKEVARRSGGKAAVRQQGLTVRAVIALRVRQARADRGMTQDNLAQWMDTLGHRMLRSQLAKIELGTRDTSVQELVALAFALDVSPSLLLTPPEGELLQVMDANSDFVMSPETTWGWLGGERLLNANVEPIFPEHIERQRIEDELLARADEIRARRALEGGAQA